MKVGKKKKKEGLILIETRRSKSILRQASPKFREEEGINIDHKIKKSRLKFNNKGIKVSECPLEAIYNEHVDKIREIDTEKEQNPRPIKIQFVYNSEKKLSFIKLKPVIFDSAPLENVKNKF